jgi:hypothetical protein
MSFHTSTKIIPGYSRFGPELGIKIGWNFPTIQRDMLVSQEPFSSDPVGSAILDASGRPLLSSITSRPKGLVLRPGMDDPVMLIANANSILVEDPKEAGELFKQARQTLDLSNYQRGDIYVTAALGEARWGEIDDSTLSALDRVREIASENEALLRHERFVRATAFFNANNTESALDVLLDITGDDDTIDVTTVLAHVAMADIYMSRGVTSTHDAREMNFTFARNILLGDIPKVMEALPDVDDLKETLDKVYMHNASVFARHSYPAFAKEILAAMDVDTFDESVKSERIKARCLAALSNANFPRQALFWKTITLGALVSAGSATAIRYGYISYPEIMQAMGVGAASAAALMKAYLGWTSPEARQAYEAAHVDQSTWGSLRVGGGEFLKLLGTYAFFGGVLPGIGALAAYGGPDLLLAHADGNLGQFHGAGSFLGSIFDATVEHGGQALHLFSIHDFDKAVSIFWNDFSANTVLGKSLKKGYYFWEKNITKAFTEMPSQIYDKLLQTASFENPVDSILRLYKGITAAYAITVMVRPQIREKLQRRYKHLQFYEMPFLLGAYMLAIDINLATGVKWKDAHWIPALGIASQLRHHVMSGGRYNNIDWAAVMRATLIPTLYAGTGQQIRASEKSDPLWSHFQDSMAVQFWLYPIGFVHAWLAGLDVWEQAKIKGAKWWREETIGNVGRLKLGWASFEGTAWSMGFQQLAGNVNMSTWKKEASGTPSQLMAFQKMIAPSGESALTNDSDAKIQLSADQIRRAKKLRDEAKELKRLAMAVGPRWNFWREYKRASRNTRLKMMTALYYMPTVNDNLFPTRPGVKYYYREERGVYGVLMDSLTPDAVIEEFLNDLEVIVMDVDPRRQAMRYNLMLAAWSASKGPHGELIQRFFEKVFASNPRIKEVFEDKKMKPPKQWYPALARRRWFTNRMIGDKAKSLESSAAVAGCSWPYWGFPAGETWVQRLPWLHAFYSTWVRKDMAFPTNPMDKYYRATIFRILIDEETPPEEIDQYLQYLSELSDDIDFKRSSTRFNLMLTTRAAAEVGPHKKRIRKFFENIGWKKEWYGIPGIEEEFDVPTDYKGRYARKWFKKNLKGNDVIANGMNHARTSLWERIKRRASWSYNG